MSEGQVEVEVEVVAEPEPEGEPTAIHDPGRLLRIAMMLREMQEEARRAPTDESGRERLRIVQERAVTQLCEALSGDLREEFSSLNLGFGEGTPSESELLIAQAQLVGWLEGLFQGIQAAIASQQMMARQQLEQMRGRALPPGQRVLTPGGGGPDGPPPGQYL